MTTKWPTVALREVAVIERASVSAGDIESGTTYVGLEHITPAGRVVGHGPVQAGELLSNKFRFTSAHVLYGKLRPNLSKIVAPDFSGVCSTDILPIRPSDRLDKRYLLHFLRQPSEVAKAASLASGANLPRLSPKVLAELPIPLPPVDEQRRIAAVLDQASELRAKRQTSLALLGTLNESVFLDMFGEPVGNPRGWQVVRLADVSREIQIGPFGSLLHQSDYVEGGVPLINPMHIVGDRIVPDSMHAVGPEKLAELGRYVLTEGDIVMARRGEMGRCAVVDAASAGMVCGSGSLYIRPDDTRVDVGYLHEVLTSAGMKVHLERKALGVTMANLNGAIVGDLPIPLPPLSLQQRFASAMTLARDQRERLTCSSLGLDEFFASLQQRAFAGQL